MKIKDVKVNAGRRKVDSEKVALLAESINKLGLLNAITVNKDFTLIAGMHRLEACKLLGYEDISANVIDLDVLLAELAEIDENLVRNDLHWTEQDKQLARRKEIFEKLHPETKKGAVNQYTKEVLNEIISFSKTFSEDTADKLGQSQRNVQMSIARGKEITETEAEILKSIDAPKSFGDALIKQSTEIRKKICDNILDKKATNTKFKSITSVIKEEIKKEFIENSIVNKKLIPKTFQLFNDDCLNILEHLDNDSIDCVLTDPPYAIDFNHSWNASQIDNDDEETALKLLDNVCKILVLKCKKDAHLYIFSGWLKLAEFKTIIEQYFDLSNILVWVKNNTSLVNFDKRYAFKYENVFFCKQKNNNERSLQNKQSPDVLNFDRVNSPEHPTEKPVELLEYLLKNSTIENELVLDCFMGSGSTGVACLNNNRNFIGIELNKKHYSYARARMAK